MAFRGGNPNGLQLADEGYMEPAQRNTFTEEACHTVNASSVNVFLCAGSMYPSPASCKPLGLPP